jgi:hypothetical protein
LNWNASYNHIWCDIIGGSLSPSGMSLGIQSQISVLLSPSSMSLGIQSQIGVFKWIMHIVIIMDIIGKYYIEKWE